MEILLYLLLIESFIYDLNIFILYQEYYHAIKLWKVKLNKVSLAEFISFKVGYFNNNKLSNWKSSVNSLYSDISKYKIETLKLDNNIILELKLLKNNYDTGETIRSIFNKKFIDEFLWICERD